MPILRRRTFGWLSVLLLLCAAHSEAREDAAEPRVLNAQVDPVWLSPDRVLWRRELPGGGTRWMSARDTGQAVATPAPAFDHADAARLLGESLQRDVHPDALPLSRWAVVEGQPMALVHGARWVLVLDNVRGVSVEPSDTLDAFRSPETPDRRSGSGGPHTEIVVRNETATPVRLVWLDGSGQRHDYATIEADQEHVQSTYAGHVWMVLDPGDRALGFYKAQRGGSLVVTTPRDHSGPPEPAPTEPEQPEAPQEPGVSPDGRWRVETTHATVVLHDTETGERTVLADDGSPQDRYGKRVWWSPTSSHFVVMQTVPGFDRRITIVESSPRDQLQPKRREFSYRKPGDAIERPRPRLFGVEQRAQVPVSEALFDNPWSLSRLAWRADGSAFSFVYNQRGHTEMRLISVDADTGRARAVIDENPETFFDYATKFFLHRDEARGQALWMSERDGWNHLYLIDLDTGSVVRQVTRGSWVLRGVESIDDEARTVLFRASGVAPGQDPYHVHYARADLDTGDITWLTQGDGAHDLEPGPGGRLYLTRYSRVDLPPVTELRRTADGSLVATLERADATPLRQAGWRAPERFVAKGRDGETDIWGILHLPKGFDPGAQYPVIEQIYAGPHGQHVPKTFRTRYGAQRLADQGYVVVQIDGMGTNWRSKAFHDVAWKNLGDSGFPDRIAWMRAAAETRPYMDLGRVGIYGTSAGGQNAMRAVTEPAFSGFYDAAVADCGCHDNRMDKIWWNELWMSWPVGPHYEAQSNVTNAHKLDGELLLIIGEVDQNVDPASTMQVADALIRAGKDFELVVMPGVGHGALGTPFGQKKMDDFFRRALREPAE